jgi:CRISPR/Cas system CSM-associated protein Csm3 (group 7 of RAMP superfamily)
MRYIADITIKTKTPLKIGSGSDFLRDMIIQKDWNNLPIILGTSITGVIRKEFSEDRANEIFGFGGEDGEGSKVVISNALLLNNDNKVIEELLLEKNEYLRIFDVLPIRDHTAISDKGVAKKHSKYDEEVIFKGAKFKFRIESLNKEYLKEILSVLKSKKFRLGGGTTRGFGAIDIEEIKLSKFDDNNLDQYDSSLNFKLPDNLKLDIPQREDNLIHYELVLKPDDFFMFGSGYGDNKADMTPKKEMVIEDFKLKQKLLIPASSIKGAISHRCAFYNNGEILIEIFGEKKDENQGQKGKVYFEDVFLDDYNEKIFQHVAIDRFTGGAIDGALFQEKTVKTNEFKINIYLENSISQKSIEIFEKSLKDIVIGMLPLGGAVSKGHGVFRGKVIKNGEIL